MDEVAFINRRCEGVPSLLKRMRTGAGALWASPLETGGQTPSFLSMRLARPRSYWFYDVPRLREVLLKKGVANL
jgi:hypothetical protein